MTDAELEQLIADKAYAFTKYQDHARDAQRWERRWVEISQRIDLVMQADNSEFVRQVKEG